YRLYYGQERGYYTAAIDVGNSTTADVPNLIEGTMYYFAVTAYAADGMESVPSEEFRYTPNPGVLLNMATRAMVQTGDNVMIAGFIVGGLGPKKIVVRALGPTLKEAGVRNTLADPVLEVFAADGSSIVANDNWSESDTNAIAALDLVPRHDLEAATLLVLNPGSYSVVVSGKGKTVGVALLEVYDAGSP
ncbi:MAG TPA: fibronectin type III domain-containing protein, partial [Chthoniobacterales bacterium]